MSKATDGANEHDDSHPPSFCAVAAYRPMWCAITPAYDGDAATYATGIAPWEDMPMQRPGDNSVCHLIDRASQLES